MLSLRANLDKHEETGVLYKYDGGEKEEKKEKLHAPPRIDADYTGCWYMELGSICKTILIWGVEEPMSSINAQRCRVRFYVWVEAQLAAHIEEVADDAGSLDLLVLCAGTNIHGPWVLSNADGCTMKTCEKRELEHDPGDSCFEAAQQIAYQPRLVSRRPRPK